MMRSFQHKYRLPLSAGLVVLFCAGLLTVDAKALDVVVSVQDVTGQKRTGTLIELTPTAVSLGNQEEEETLSHEDLVLLKFDNRPVERPPRNAFFLLENGDRIAARPLAIDPEKVVASWTQFPAWPAFEIPLETVRFTIIQPSQSQSIREENLRLLRRRREKTDLLILTNGDRVVGEFLGMKETGVSLKTAAGEIAIPPAVVRAIGFNPELLNFPESEGPCCMLTLTDGTRLTVREVHSETPEQLACKADFGWEFEIPTIEVSSIRFLRGRAVYLSDLSEADYEHVPYLSGEWSLARDQNVTGTALQLRGVEYAKGLGMHSRSRVDYELAGAYQSCQAVVGIDDVADGKGSVVFAVAVDGKEVFRSGVIDGKSTAVSVPMIDLNGAKQLSLLVDYGEFGDTADYANWCDAFLVQKLVESSQ